MFIDAAVFKRLCKKAYKTNGLVIQATEDWYIINGKWWQLEVEREHLNKKEKAILIELTGDLPLIGETYRADILGNQYELEDASVHFAGMSVFKMPIQVKKTRIIMESKEGRLYRIMKTNKAAFKLNQVYLDMISISSMDKDEAMPRGPVVETEYPNWVYWDNGTCRFMAYAAMADDDTYEGKFLDELCDLEAGENG